MRIRRIVGTALLLPLALLGPNVVSANSTASLSDLPLTPQEEAARIWGLAGQTMARELFPSVTDSIKPLQRNYQELVGGNVRGHQLRDLAKTMGEKGGGWYAARHGLKELLGARHSGIPQGPDSVYWDPYSGYVFVLETKGGYAKVASFYGARQDTNEYSIRAAERILRSPSANPHAKVVAARIIVAAQEGRLVTGAIEAPPKGDPLLLYNKWNLTNVAEEAREIERRNPKNQKDFRRARWAARVTRGVAITGIAGALGLGWDAYQQTQAAWSMFDDPSRKGSVLSYMQTGIAFGRVVQATTLGVISSAPLGAWKLSASLAGARHYVLQSPPTGIWRLSARGVVRGAGGAFMAVTLGVEGLQLAMVYRERELGRISQREYYRRRTGPAITMTLTVGGAALGGIVGAFPGAVIGANIGALAAIPVQSAAYYMLDRRYQEFDERQRRFVNAEIETFYGLESRDEEAGH